jgi:N-glycosidase YbiA
MMYGVPAMPEVIRFYRTNDLYGHFSNFSPHRVFIDYNFPTSEHYFQSQKFLAGEALLEFLMTPKPMQAAKLGRSRKWPLRPDWEDVKDDVMRTAIRAKVAQNSDVRDLLLSTGEAIIVEHTANDSYWADGGDGTGKNMLGRILMEVRAEFTKDGPYDELAEPLLPPWEKYPDIPLWSIGWRMGYGEDYMIEWTVWFHGLSAKGRTTYFHSLSIPEEWADWGQRQFERSRN